MQKKKEDFYNDKTSSDGKTNWCKKCYKDYYYENKEKRNAYSRQWKKNNRDKVKKYRRKRRDKIREYQKKWREENKSKQKKYWETRYKKFRNKILEYHKEYRKKNPEKRAKWDRARRARENGARGNGVSAKEWNIILDFYGNKCLSCRKKEDICMDHVIALSEGGSHDVSNIQPLCRSCNSSKGTDSTDYRPLIWAFFIYGLKKKKQNV